MKGRAMNSIAEVVSHYVFSMFLSNFCAQEQMRPENIIVKVAAYFPVTLVILAEPASEWLCVTVGMFRPIPPEPIAQERHYQ